MTNHDGSVFTTTHHGEYQILLDDLCICAACENSRDWKKKYTATLVNDYEIYKPQLKASFEDMDPEQKMREYAHADIETVARIWDLQYISRLHKPKSKWKPSSEDIEEVLFVLVCWIFVSAFTFALVNILWTVLNSLR